VLEVSEAVALEEVVKKCEESGGDPAGCDEELPSFRPASGVMAIATAPAAVLLGHRGSFLSMPGVPAVPGRAHYFWGQCPDLSFRSGMAFMRPEAVTSA
jgi:hypothetical protein